MVSQRTLAGVKNLPRARAPWLLDSGAFTEVAKNGRHTTPPHEYAKIIRRCVEDIGNLVWAAPQDWMCEPHILKRTGYRVEDHQHLTVDNFCHLRELAPDLPIIPVLQGWTLADYQRCIRMYGYAGVDLSAEPVVGIGSVCRRQSTRDIMDIIGGVAAEGLPLHGFGVKTKGLALIGKYLFSADSMAWSFNARKHPPLPGHETRHKNCANCLPWALRWRHNVLKQLAP